MDPDDLIALVKRAPFEPIRLHLSDGATFDLLHPDQIIISRRHVAVGINEAGDGVYMRLAFLSLLHITRVEPLNGNAPTKRKRSGS